MSLINIGQKDSGIVVRTGANISKPEDLRGRRIGVGTIGSISHVLFEKWLMLKGINPKGLNYVEVPFPQMPDVIRTGSVDAVLIADPFMNAIERAKSGTVLAHYFGEIRENIPAMVNVATTDWMRKNPQAATLFRAAIEEAIAFSIADSNAMLDIVAKTLKLKPETVRGTALTRFKGTLDVVDMKWWLDTMGEQNLLRSRIDPASLVTK